MKSLSCLVLTALMCGSVGAQSGAAPVVTYAGICDASAAVAIDAEHFVVGNDENNTLYVYRRGQAQAVGALDLSKFLGTAADEESDIEAAALAGSRIYWITSHGRNSSAKARPSRQRFFATDMMSAPSGKAPTLKPVGEAYARLLDDMTKADVLKPYKLRDAARRAPEAEGGFNIEGLAATPEGGLLIGLRNPLFQKRALVIPLQNPAELIQGGARARFGTPIELDLGGRGIRSIELIGGSYFVVAGPTADVGDFVLFRWSGKPGDAPAQIEKVDQRGLRPEALFAVSPSGSLQLLSDDGGVESNGVACKEQAAARQAFRSVIVTP